MAKAYEITIWKTRPGKRAEFMKSWGEVSAIFKKAGVSEIQLLEGVAGKDVGNVVVIQTFKNLADNGAVNDSIGENDEMKAWMVAHKDDDFAELVSHDLYSEA